MKSHHVLIASGTALAGGAGLWYLLYGLPAYRRQLRTAELLGHEPPHSPVAAAVTIAAVGAFLILLGVIRLAVAHARAVSDLRIAPTFATAPTFRSPLKPGELKH